MKAALLVLATFLVTKNVGQLIKLPQDVTWSSTKHSKSDESDSGDSRTEAPSEDVGSSKNSPQGSNNLPSPATSCKLQRSRWRLTSEGCISEWITTAKCYGHCLSYLEPIPLKNRKVAGQLFTSKCECCQSTGLVHTEVTLHCPGSRNKTVKLQQPTGCKCKDCLDISTDKTGAVMNALLRHSTYLGCASVHRGS
jgi:hypothetical protein